MKITKNIQSLFLALGAIATTSLTGTMPANAATTFQEKQVSQDDFAVVAVPFGYQEHRLEIIEQVPGGKKCWNESGVSPVKVDLLLLDYDYTASCRRAINTNGYTLRLNGEDERVARVLKIVKNKGELQLVAFHKDPSQPHLVIGRSQGLSDGAMKIMLNPGWQITKRVHQGQVVNHIYLSGDSAIANYTYKPSSTNSSVATTKPAPAPAPAPTGEANTQPELDKEAIAEGVAQIYESVVQPWLKDLSQQQQ